MRYFGSVTVPADTSAANPATAEVEVCFGTIAEFYRLIPPGCAGMVRLQVFHQTRQIFPTTPGESYIGDGSEVLGLAGVVVDEPPTILELRAWSPGSTYQHVIYCEFYIARPYILTYTPLEPVSLPEGL